ncbi:hypothetical protein DQ04_00691010 [Trypanosoma grayi]|uniref:hypothetical protein n=1 Tax=Trypanosoma grayi TaxID=71804 RepID=UPI0004F420C1|nr:hypothetical protein DQ04_00691010 [Trypanosoma grayi]KEG13955.1 hypothetical protein DQ04_00691010 [Trypanosoma grayi]
MVINSRNDDGDDDIVTLLESCDVSDVETCTTQTTPILDAEAEEDECDNDYHGAAHDSQLARCMASQSSRRCTTVSRKPLCPLTSSTRVVALTTSEMPLHRAIEGEMPPPPAATVAFPVLHASFEAVGGTQRQGGAHRYLVPMTGAEWWTTAGTAPPLRLTCTYHVSRSDVAAALGSVCPQQTRHTVSRVHCEVRLHFRLQQQQQQQQPMQDGSSTAPHAANYKWTLFDIVDCSSSNGTFYGGVRLFPSHRYSFPVKGDLRCVELGLGDRCRLRVFMEDGTVPFAAKTAEPGEAAVPVEKIGVGVQWTTTGPPPRRRPSPQKHQQVKKPRTVREKESASCFSRRGGRAQKSKRACVDDDTVPFIPTRSNSTNECSDKALTIVTTGIRVTPAKAAKLRRLNITVNPAMSKFPCATHLVVEGPLVRSVKLMTSLPYVQHIVDRRWLDAVIASSSSLPHSVDPDAFRYTERRTRCSIETVNDFSLEELMRTPVLQRQALFAGQLFWVHPNAEPQCPPDNDLRFVISASGGVITTNASDATVAVMPRVEVTASLWRHAAQCPLEPQCIFVVPNDVFRAVLQQRRLTETTVRHPKGVDTLPPRPQDPQLAAKEHAPAAPESPRAAKRRRR